MSKKKITSKQKTKTKKSTKESNIYIYIYLFIYIAYWTYVILEWGVCFVLFGKT